jgi:hypothetical protein
MKIDILCSKTVNKVSFITQPTIDRFRPLIRTAKIKSKEVRETESSNEYA